MTSPVNSGSALSSKRAKAAQIATTNQIHFNDSPATMALNNRGAGAIPGVNMRQPKTAVPTATIIPPVKAAIAAAAPPIIQNSNPAKVAHPICRSTTRHTSRNLTPKMLFMLMGAGATPTFGSRCCPKAGAL